MNLPPLPKILPVATVLASLALVLFFHWARRNTAYSPVVKRDALSLLVSDDVQPEAPQQSQEPDSIATPEALLESDKLSFTPLPSIDSSTSPGEKIETENLPPYNSQAIATVDVDVSFRTKTTREADDQVAQTIFTEPLPAWNEPQKDQIAFVQKAQYVQENQFAVAESNLSQPFELKIDESEPDDSPDFSIFKSSDNSFNDTEQLLDDVASIQPEIPADTSNSFAEQAALETAMIFEQIRNTRITAAEHEIRWSLNDAIMASLAYSNRVSSLRIESTEELQNVGVESGQFDVVGFLNQSFRNSSEPVGSVIETASIAQTVIQEEDINIAYGLRKQLRSGGEVELNQSYQFRDNDSGILIPENQAFSRTNARVSKELLRGAGRSIALNEVLVAYHDASAQKAESVAEIANHLNDVMTAYWDIVAARGALFASMENRELAVQVLYELEARKDIDAERNLLDQAKATIRQRELSINDAHNNLIQAQIRLVSLVNAPELLANLNMIEILPQFDPDLETHEIDVNSRLNTAIQRRPEIADAIEQIKAAQVTDHLSLNELLPRLTASVEASLNGLEGNRDLGGAIENEFDNDLTYQVGFDFEVPFTNRQARHTKRRTELTVSRLKADWQNMIEQVKADVLNNAQEFSASQIRLKKQRDILEFSGSELQYLGLRKTIAPKENSNPSFALTQVLAAQDRQGGAKSQFIAAIADKHRALFELNRATGILINQDVIPQDGGPARPGLFSVYHQYIEDRPQFVCPAVTLERETKFQARRAKRERRTGVQQLIVPNQ